MVATAPHPAPSRRRTRTNSIARQFSTAPARCSWISGLTAPAWAKSPAPPASPRGRCMFILRQEPAVRSHRRGASARTGQGGLQFRPERDVGTTFEISAKPISSRCAGRRRIGNPHRDGDRRADAGFRPPLLRACAGKNHRTGLADYLEAL